MPFLFAHDDRTYLNIADITFLAKKLQKYCNLNKPNNIIRVKGKNNSYLQRP